MFLKKFPLEGDVKLLHPAKAVCIEVCTSVRRVRANQAILNCGTSESESPKPVPFPCKGVCAANLPLPITFGPIMKNDWLK